MEDIMGIKTYDLVAIRRQMVANIYNLLRAKGYDPDEGVNIEELLGERPEMVVSSTYSLGYDNEIAAYPFLVSFIRCFGEDEFELYEDNPDEFDDVDSVDSRDLFIESLDDLYRAIMRLDDKVEDGEE